MKHSLLFITTLLVLTWHALITQGCSSFPTPIPIDLNHPTIQKAFNDVDQMLEANMKATGVLNYMATITYRDELVWSKAYGQVNPLDPKSPPLTIDNTVRIASITKTFTDLMMYELRDRGIISLDDPVSKYYPEFTVRDPYGTAREITFRQLASHQTGLPREVPCNFDELQDPTKCSEATILERLGETFLILPQYYHVHYSNLGMSVLGRTCEKAANKLYEDYVQEKILNPLGMLNSSYYYDDIKDRMAVGLNLDNGTYSAADIYPLGWGTPMGGLYSSGRDMARYAAFWLSEENVILDSSTVHQAIQAGVYLVNDGQSSYGTPWETFFSTQNNLWIREKAGALDGYRSQLGLVREYRLGVFISAMLFINTEDVWMMDAMDILIPAFDAVLREAGSPIQIPGVPVNTSPHKASLPNSAFVGLYLDDINGECFRVMENGEQLTADFCDGRTFNVTEFSSETPTLKRIQVADASLDTCWYMTMGENYEIAYFYFGDDRATSVMIMGQTTPLYSTNPNEVVARKKTMSARRMFN
ncbi:hypothetical protein SAMD00019534_087780 [Acytostelium subglobosum LB1]|uniref:hypothetical protein n=1 Tax=Acytostelium subglobosum LB1 TaxID=1410327 RepID=UPI0006447C40|nr:hypothetical protein SAMD00019534_087780 [Acytostelium subglobosum LB1]GAM25603.1 hypothetical protein SAMD00019534_087780 [Acytostelium subglobosum LB1]|eukprot:XP_012751589.1 hypothetical protein SAMD00019534_087780 [Acytostelium subglobosum LB1]